MGELMDFTKSEETQMEEFVKGLVEAKVDVVFCKGAVQDIATHYLNKYKIMVIKITSKFDIKRLCKALNATALVRLGKPLPEEIGYAEDIHCEELGGTKVVTALYAAHAQGQKTYGVNLADEVVTPHDAAAA